MTETSPPGLTDPAAGAPGRRPALLSLPERFPGRVIAAIGLLFALAYGASIVFIPKADGRLLVGDALHHYVQLRSAIFDGDLRFRNDYVALYGLKGGEPGTEWVYEPTPTGHTRNLMPVGPAILWAPAYLAIAAGIWIANAAGAGYPFDGNGRLFQAAAGFTGIAAAAAGAWLSYLAAHRLFRARAAIWSVVVLWLASSAVYYSVISPTYSHAPSLLTASAFWLGYVRTAGAATPARFGLLGALAGFSALMRWQDAILLVAPAIDLVWLRAAHRITVARAAICAAVCLAGAAAAFSPQMAVWQALYGQPLAIPQGAGFMRLHDPALLEMLFSANHGLISWTPVVAAALAGLAILWARDRRLTAALVTVFAVSWYVNASAADWWAGEAFGARRFISCFPIFAFGLAALLDRWSPSGRTLAWASAAVVGYTFLLLVQYQAFMKGLRDVAPYPSGGYELWLARFKVPFDLVEYWLR